MSNRNAKRLLVTGFGPFAGVLENASGVLAAKVAGLARQRWPEAHIAAALLPTEWRRGPEALGAVLDHHRPDVVLHLGISPRAQGLVVETLARNRTKETVDAIGYKPVEDRLLPGGPAALRSAVAIGPILGRLWREGVPARRSNDAGRFICNAVYYHSLLVAGRSGARRQVVLVHLPAIVGSAGVLEDGKPRNQMAEGQAVAGLLHVMDMCLEETRAAGRTRAWQLQGEQWTSIGV